MLKQALVSLSHLISYVTPPHNTHQKQNFFTLSLADHKKPFLHTRRFFRYNPLRFIAVRIIMHPLPAIAYVHTLTSSSSPQRNDHIQWNRLLTNRGTKPKLEHPNVNFQHASKSVHGMPLPLWNERFLCLHISRKKLQLITTN